jgi:hypothetical protein
MTVKLASLALAFATPVQRRCTPPPESISVLCDPQPASVACEGLAFDVALHRPEYGRPIHAGGKCTYHRDWA